MATTSGVDLSISGLATGFDWKSVVTQLANAERASETVWKNTQIKINGKNTAFDRIKTFLSTLQTDVQKLKDSSLYNGRTTSTSSSTIATAIAGTDATAGTFAFNISQLATAAHINGTSDIGKPISSDGNLANVILGSAGFATAVTAGTFTVNGKQITLATTDTLQQVFDNIAAATNNTVAASYDTNTDKITLTGSGWQRSHSRQRGGHEQLSSSHPALQQRHRLHRQRLRARPRPPDRHLVQRQADHRHHRRRQRRWPTSTSMASPSVTTPARTAFRTCSTASTILRRELRPVTIHRTTGSCWPTKPRVTSASVCRT